MIELIIIVILLVLAWLVMGDTEIVIKQPHRRASDYLGPAYDFDDRTETLFDRRQQ